MLCLIATLAKYLTYLQEPLRLSEVFLMLSEVFCSTFHKCFLLGVIPT